MKKITTSLNDIWYHDNVNKKVVSATTNREYGSNELMLRLLESSQGNTRNADRLQIIDAAPTSADGYYFFIEDKENPGFYRGVPFYDPSFDWEAEDYQHGMTLYSVENPDFRLHEQVLDPGTAYGPYFIGRWSDKDKSYGYIGCADSLEEASEIIANGIKSNIRPLPQISTRKSIIIPLQDGYSAEAMAYEGNDSVGYTVTFDISIMDRFNRLVGEISSSNLDELLKLRDDPSALKEFEDKLWKRKSDGILDLFNNTDTIYPGKFDSFCDDLDNLTPSRVVKFTTASEGHEILMCKDMPKSVTRDNSGNFISVGTPTYHQLHNLTGEVYTSSETWFTAYVKRTNGVMYEKIENVVLSENGLYDLVMFDDEESSFLENESELSDRIPGAKERFIYGQTTTIAELMVASITCSAQEIRESDCKKVFINVDALRRKLTKPENNIEYNL